MDACNPYLGSDILFVYRWTCVPCATTVHIVVDAAAYSSLTQGLSSPTHSSAYFTSTHTLL